MITALALILGSGSPYEVSGQAPDALRASFELAIDANVDNGDGPCDPVDDEAYVEVRAVHRVAVCALNPPVAPHAFFIRVVYDGQLNIAPETPDVPPALDDNPDANAGRTTFSDPDLGDGWDCTGLTVFPPKGDDENTPELHDATIACNADLRNPDTTLVESGPLAFITFEVVGQGDDHLEFDPGTHVVDGYRIIGRCDVAPSGPQQMVPCLGAVIHKGDGTTPSTPAGEGTPELPPEASSSPSPGPSPSSPTGIETPAAAPQEATASAVGPTSEEDEDGGFPWAALGAALGGFAVLLAVAGGFYAWRRASGPRV